MHTRYSRPVLHVPKMGGSSSSSHALHPYSTQFIARAQIARYPPCWAIWVFIVVFIMVQGRILLTSQARRWWTHGGTGGMEEFAQEFF